MNDTVREWIRKGQADLATASRELGAPENPNFDAVCFHSQQSVEKLLKGLAVDRGILPPKSHDLITLASLVRETIDLTAEISSLNFLTRGAVVFRYPGDSATDDEAEQAYGLAVRLSKTLMPLFGPESTQPERSETT